MKKKEAYFREFDSKLSTVSEMLKKLKLTLSKQNDHLQQKYDRRVEVLMAKADEAKSLLVVLSEEGEEDPELQVEFEQSFYHLKKAVNDIVDKLKNE